MSVFASRQIVMPVIQTPIAVTITGSGKVRFCYAIINGMEQYEAGTHEVYSGDTITFGVHGYNTGSAGWVKIDGTEVLRVTDETTQTYEWTVPRGISTIGIAMRISSFSSYGTITVTTA